MLIEKISGQHTGRYWPNDRQTEYGIIYIEKNKKTKKPRRANIMKKIAFSEAIDNKVEVTINGNKYGILIFDHEKNIWVLWPEDIDDGVSYFEDLEETEETIKDEIIAFDKGY